MKKHKLWQNLLLFSIFGFYLVILCALLFSKRFPHRSINIVPFHEIISYLSGNDAVLRSFSFINVFGNIILFIPMGIYITLFKRDKRIYTNILWVFLVSVSVEIVQYIFAIGVSDIDDVILNCLGGLTGIIVYKTLLFLFKDENKVRNIIAIGAPICGIICIFINFLYNM